jgi:CheY-like chemotaxis protein
VAFLQEKTVSAILIVEKDPVFGAVLEDRLYVAGHDVELLMDRERAVDVVSEGQIDLLILEIAQPDNVGLDVVTELRGRAETNSLPVLVLSRSTESSDRVAALRAGADDFLTKPCDLEELTLRAERLVQSRGVQAPLLQGDLTNHPLWELVQYVQQAGKTGALVLRGPTGSGRIGFHNGQIYVAQWLELSSRESLLTLLGMKLGRFRFVVSEEFDEASDTVLLLPEALMQVAWLEDQLEKRIDQLPATGVPLTLTDTECPPLEEELTQAGLPLSEICDRVRQKPGSRVFDLIGHLQVAPQKIRLAVAWLVSQGVLTVPADMEFDAYPTTGEITSTKMIDMVVDELLDAARRVGFGTSALPFLIGFEPSKRADLVALFESFPGFQHNEPLCKLVGELRSSSATSVTFATESGKLVLHVRELALESGSELEGIITVAAGALMWLGDDAHSADLLRLLVERLETNATAAGVVVATTPRTRDLASALTASGQRWQISAHAPKSLLGVFRLLTPSSEPPS